jgi:hypothetical protein
LQHFLAQAHTKCTRECVAVCVGINAFFAAPAATPTHTHLHTHTCTHTHTHTHTHTLARTHTHSHTHTHTHTHAHTHTLSPARSRTPTLTHTHTHTHARTHTHTHSHTHTHTHTHARTHTHTHTHTPSCVHRYAALEGPTCGLLPLAGPATSVTTIGLKWDIEDAEISMGKYVRAATVCSWHSSLCSLSSVTLFTHNRHPLCSLS